MFALGLPFLALLVASVESHLGVLGPKNVSQKDAEFEHTYVDEVNSELVNIYTFNHTVTRNRVRAGAGPGLGPRGLGESASPLPFRRPHERAALLGSRSPELHWSLLTSFPSLAASVFLKLPLDSF